MAHTLFTSRGEREKEGGERKRAREREKGGRERVRKRERESKREGERERDRDVELLFLKGMTGALAPFSCLVFYIYQPEAVKHFFPILKPIRDILEKFSM
jgi:hypothetical protein